MKMFANENLFEPVIDYLREIGNDVRSVREGLSGIFDDEVYELACKEKRVIITMDKDFSRVFRFPPENFFTLYLRNGKISRNHLIDNLYDNKTLKK